ncbi:phosducin-like protein 3 [Biomphalaria glabrata]|uniref:Phosducin-like protein 3 n=1 Tax=Biomphalaria glabrata TaxID=6526 RepID=A0A9U8EDH8_BIOGL|nr:phosducin-like protein 3 [Biomphalaria glabrata]KAI8736806.1 phosducin-like protein 3 [Biomphalaria glabrata]
MQNPNEDTEWNDALRRHNIIPQKEKEKELTEEDIVNLLEQTVEAKQQGKGLNELTLDELNEREDDIDEEEERIFEEYRRQRLAEMKKAYTNARYGEVVEISKADYVSQVNNAGEGVWVVLHIYKDGIPICKLVNNFLTNLARKFPQTKFLRSISSVCIPNYPDKNLPTVFVYFEGDLKKQWIGPFAFGGMNLKQNELEWMLAQAGAIQSDIEKPERAEIEDVMTSAIRQSRIDNEEESDN